MSLKKVSGLHEISIMLSNCIDNLEVTSNWMWQLEIFKLVNQVLLDFGPSSIAIDVGFIWVSKYLHFYGGEGCSTLRLDDLWRILEKNNGGKRKNFKKIIFS